MPLRRCRARTRREFTGPRRRPVLRHLRSPMLSFFRGRELTAAFHPEISAGLLRKPLFAPPSSLLTGSQTTGRWYRPFCSAGTRGDRRPALRGRRHRRGAIPQYAARLHACNGFRSFRRTALLILFPDLQAWSFASRRRLIRRLTGDAGNRHWPTDRCPRGVHRRFSRLRHALHVFGRPCRYALRARLEAWR